VSLDQGKAAGISLKGAKIAKFGGSITRNILFRFILSARPHAGATTPDKPD